VEGVSASAVNHPTEICRASASGRLTG